MPYAETPVASRQQIPSRVQLYARVETTLQITIGVQYGAFKSKPWEPARDEDNMKASNKPGWVVGAATATTEEGGVVRAACKSRF